MWITTQRAKETVVVSSLTNYNATYNILSFLSRTTNTSLCSGPLTITKKIGPASNQIEYINDRITPIVTGVASRSVGFGASGAHHWCRNGSQTDHTALYTNLRDSLVIQFLKDKVPDLNVTGNIVI